MRARISRPHDGHTRRRLRHSSALFCSPASAINQPTPSVATAIVSTCGSIIFATSVLLAGVPSNLLPGMGVRSEVQLAAAAIGYVRVQLGCGEIRVSEHFLNRAEVGSALQEMRGERVSKQVHRLC